MGQNTSCLTLCDVPLSEQESDEAAELIQESYSVDWSVDNLPGRAFIWYHESDDYYDYLQHFGSLQTSYFPLGQVGRYDSLYQFENESVYVNNHMSLEFLYETSKVDPKKNYIVEFRVSLKSYENPDSCGKQTNNYPMKVVGKGATTVTYTYSVGWAETTEITWKERWNRYQAYTYER
ncbi:hypothetical protein DFQ29_003630, partial [Apophysomyces sp. BC1021]